MYENVIYPIFEEYIVTMKKIFPLFPVLFLFLPIFSLSGCSSLDYADYVSEYRSELLIAESEGYSLTACLTLRETPYAPDGVVGTTSEIIEVFLTVPDNTAEYALSFWADGAEYGGDMSYNSVYSRFEYSRALSAVPTEFTVRTKENEVTLVASSVKSGNELPMPELIARLATDRQEYFSEKTAGNTFHGEMRVRLLYDGSARFYVEVATAQGTDACFLLDACTGEVLSEKYLR